MAFSWAGAAGGAQGALRQQQQDALAAQQAQAQLEEMLALRHYRNQQVEAEKQRMDFARQQFEVQQAQREQEASDQRNQRGLMMMAGDIADQYPDDPSKMVGTLIRAGQNVPAALLAPPQGAEPFTLGPGQLRFDSSGNQVAQGLPPTADSPDPFTLGPGQVRFDAEGNQVATGPPQRPLAGQQPRRVLSGDANRIAEIDTALNDVDTLEREIGQTGAASKIGALVPNVVTEFTGWGQDAKQRQAVIDRVKQVIGKTLEGGVLRREDEYKYVKILPTIGDDPEVARTKIQGLRAAIQQRKGATLDALEDAEFNVDNFRTRQGAPGGGGGGGAVRWGRDAQGRPVRIQ